MTIRCEEVVHMGNLFGGLGLGGCDGDNSFVWIILVIILILFLGNNNECGNPCDGVGGEQQNDWIWILIVLAILFLCNGNNGLFGGSCDCKKPC
jgi:hypothetical protein